MAFPSVDRDLVLDTIRIARKGLAIAIANGDSESTRVHAKGIAHCYRLLGHEWMLS